MAPRQWYQGNTTTIVHNATHQTLRENVFCLLGTLVPVSGGRYKDTGGSRDTHGTHVGAHGHTEHTESGIHTLSIDTDPHTQHNSPTNLQPMPLIIATFRAPRVQISNRRFVRKLPIAN